MPAACILRCNIFHAGHAASDVVAVDSQLHLLRPCRPLIASPQPFWLRGRSSILSLSLSLSLSLLLLSCVSCLTVLLMQATYFDPASDVNHAPLTCAGKLLGLAELPSVAISSAHLVGSKNGCGQCLVLSGTGSGIGGVPVSTAPSK